MRFTPLTGIFHSRLQFQKVEGMRTLLALEPIFTSVSYLVKDLVKYLAKDLTQALK